MIREHALFLAIRVGDGRVSSSFHILNHHGNFFPLKDWLKTHLFLKITNKIAYFVLAKHETGRHCCVAEPKQAFLRA